MIHRRANERRWISLPPSVINDTRLSWQARGLLCYLLSKPDRWEVSVNQLVHASPDGKTVVQSAMRELKELGYAILVTVYDERRLAGKRWDITDYPEEGGNSDDTLDDFPTDRFSDHREISTPKQAENQPKFQSDEQVSRRTGFPMIGEPRRISTLESLSTLEKKSKKTPSLVLPPGETPPTNFDDQGAIEEEEPQEKKPKRLVKIKRPGRHCPDDFEVTEEMYTWAAENFPTVDIERETAAFRDHEYPRPYSDWGKAWRNWIRKALEIQQRTPHPGYQRSANGYQARGAAAPRQTNDPVADKWINRTDEPVRASHKVFDTPLPKTEELPSPEEIKNYMDEFQAMFRKTANNMDMNAAISRENRPRRLGIVQDDAEDGSDER